MTSADMNILQKFLFVWDTFLLVVFILVFLQWLNPYKFTQKAGSKLKGSKHEDAFTVCSTISGTKSSSLTFYPMGRTGNRMFQYASLIGIADKNNKAFCILNNISYLNCFPDIARPKQRICSKNMSQELTNCVVHIPDLSFDKRSFSLTHLGIPADGIIKSLMQSWRYFSHMDADIRRAFEFAPKHRMVVPTFFQRVFLRETTGKLWVNDPLIIRRHRNSTDDEIVGPCFGSLPKQLLTYICIQIRRTDFVSTYGHLIYPITADFLLRAMQIFGQTFPYPVYIVVSDDIAWSKKLLQGDRFRHVHFSEEHTPCEDLAILSKCHHSIISSGSSFGWWGAYLANGHTVYYKDWLKTGKWYNIPFEPKDYFLPRWTELPRGSNGDNNTSAVKLDFGSKT